MYVCVDNAWRSEVNFSCPPPCLVRQALSLGPRAGWVLSSLDLSLSIPQHWGSKPASPYPAFIVGDRA